MQYTITKKFRFESAHRLIKGYVGKCSSVHGHSWNGHIAVKMLGTDKYDMAVDFGELGYFTKEIEMHYDHKLILAQEDEALIAFCELENSAYVTTIGNPTCETIAKEIYDRLLKYLLSKEIAHVGITVTIEETCTTSCTISTIG